VILNSIKRGNVQKLCATTPKSKFAVFDKASLVLKSKGKTIKEWDNMQSFYFYPNSVLDFLREGYIGQELRLINPDRSKASETIKKFKNSLVRFENIDTQLIEEALRYKCKISLICNLEEINESNAKILSKLNLLIVRVNNSNADLSILKGIANRKLLSGIRVYLSPDNNDFKSVAENAKKLGLDFIHVSKKLIESEQLHLKPKDILKIKSLLKLQTKKFRVILPRNLHTVFNEKFVISDKYKNSRNCAFFAHRKVLFLDKFYPCYTKSILKNDRYSSETIEGLESKSNLFGKECSDCACIYENDLFDDISNTLKGVVNPKFYLKYKQG